ncbi:hypothetical protein BDFB_003682 [Asbolus verrucosus]|uniref:Uncharacterized protein n=1 Tax=Asbolus verrucosus TaxID=1661398 RepID=A0A482W8D1_ASBVE|nr:hypothetical protein BDFB_003682 [Asbolus verrucosus]
MESQEIIPPQSVGTAIIPRVPPLATPVNAVASNVPASGGAVYLGSGSIGVVDLGNGAYALGSGSIGYSGNRSRPRPNAMVPVYPPIPASPNLIPAAVPSPAPMPPGTVFQIPNNLDFNHPFFNVPQVPQVDQNGYEYLPPNRVGFGTPTPRPPTVKTRMQFATPTALQLQPQIPQGLPPVNYDFDISLGHPSGGGLSTLG